MPSKSKAQQRFMGLVHAFNKGDVKGSEVSKKVKDVAKGMKKSDVKKYASTKHKGKPEKVKKEAIDKIREMIRMELEGCGYVMSAKNPSYKLKSPGGTGEEDKEIKESILSEGEKEKIEQLLIKYGNTPEDAKQMVSKTYNYIKKAYRNANASKKAEIMSSLMAMESTEQFSNLVEKCWKGYMIHPKRKTKKLFGKTYPNCVKKENVNRLTEMDYRGFIKYMNDFYGPKGIYPDKKKRTLGQKEIGMAYSVLLKKKPNFEIGFDSTDREMLRDILIKLRKLDPDYSKKESVNENILTKKLSKMIKEPESSIVKFTKKSGLDDASLLDFVEKLTRNNSRLKRIHTTILKKAIKGDKKSVKSIEKTLYGESVNERISVSDERHFGKRGIIIMIDDNGETVSAIFKDKKNADKFNRNKPSDIKKLLKLAKSKKYPRAIDEAVDKKQGAEILKQLGGNRFIMMTGAKHFGVGKEGLSFKIGRNSKQVNHIKIDYDRGRDLYNIKFDWVTKRGIKNKKTLKGVYADQLQKVFTMHTGMYTSL